MVIIQISNSMRDLIDLLTEATLAADQIPSRKKTTVVNPTTGEFFTRPELFLYKVQVQSPFELVNNGGPVTIDPTEIAKVADWITNGPKGTISLLTTDGRTIKNTNLQKTTEFGSTESQTVKVKPSDVFTTSDVDVKETGNQIEAILNAGGFPASEMYSKIADSPQLRQLGRLGDAIIFMAKQITEGMIPSFPENLKASDRKAIELYASEYLGVLGLVQGLVPFKQGNRDDFYAFVGNDLDSMIMFFPKASNNPLADSFSIVNDETGHAIKISSKAAGKGAAPSLTSMKLTDEVREKYPEAAAFIDLASDPGLTTFAQPFILLQSLPDEAVPEPLKLLKPALDEISDAAEKSFNTGKPLPKLVMKPFNEILTKKVRESDNTDGGKVWYAVTKAVMDAVNKQKIIPDLQPALIESLGLNFVQLYTNQKGDQLVTEAFWPAKIKGQVRLKTKGSASNPKQGKLSVEISPSDDPDVEVGTSADRDGDTADYDSTGLDKVSAASTRSRVKASDTKKLGSPKSLGRKRRS